MFKFNELKQIHLEISNNCQASCPMCSRNHHGGIENPLIKINNWTLDQFKIAINQEVLDQIDALYFCGNFGDPLLNKDLLGMCQYAVTAKSNIQIRIHTNGSLKSTAWWKELAEILPSDHTVIFAIDGLGDTHSLYRIGTDYDQILRNAKAFISAGGNADWAFIRFKHNEHQVDNARALASELGFKSFTMKDSSRFVLDRSFPVLNKSSEITHYLEPANESKMVFIDRKDIDNYKTIVEQSTIDCYALKNKEIYIDAFGHLFPCCWLAATPYNYIDENINMLSVKQEMLNQYHLMISDFGGIDNIDTNNFSVKEIVDSDAYQQLWSKYWQGKDKLITCARACGVNKLSKPMDQFTAKEKVND